MEHLESVEERWGDLSLLKVRLRQLADPDVANPFEPEWADAERITARISELEAAQLASVKEADDAALKAKEGEADGQQ